VAPGFFAAWRDQRRLRRNAALYVQSLLEEPDTNDVGWLSDVATRGDVDRARWELRYARRASGLLSAERDALDDRTASAVARELADGWSRDRNIAAGMRQTAEQQFNARLRMLSQALTARSSPEPTGTRLGKALLDYFCPARFIELGGSLFIMLWCTLIVTGLQPEPAALMQHCGELNC